jgi:hypothetical protein
MRIVATSDSTRSANNIGVALASGQATYTVNSTFNCNINDTIRINVLVSGSTKTVGILQQNFGDYSFVNFTQIP